MKVFKARPMNSYREVTRGQLRTQNLTQYSYYLKQSWKNAHELWSLLERKLPKHPMPSYMKLGAT